ncbi:helix-turn-helix domain-containing protein [Arcticibacter sp.]|uniref:helix-turn-helix domain-containing protein n=1 Tax=Arcticibacter sp. TaxID=1872630 RepID=UPI00388FD19E
MYILADNVVALEAIWKDKAVEIEGKLADAHHNQARVNIVQQLLTEKMAESNDDLQLVSCLEQAKLNGEFLTVRQLAKTVGLSQRQLSRKFQQYVGVSPKEYLRVSRFTQSLQHLKRYPAYSLTKIAYESRYFDQAHFIRDYKEYTGYTPGVLIKSSDIVY